VCGYSYEYTKENLTEIWSIDAYGTRIMVHLRYPWLKVASNEKDFGFKQLINSYI